MLKRNIRSVIVLALSLCFTVPLIACNGGNHVENPTEEHEVRRVVLADYESYDDIFNTHRCPTAKRKSRRLRVMIVWNCA